MEKDILRETTIEYDGLITIVTGKSKSKQWKNKELKWSAFLKLLENTHRTAETTAEYKNMSKAEKGKAKEVKGGFIGGALIENGRRTNDNIKNRDLVTLDIDFGTTDIWDNIDFLFNFACCMYTTHSHTPEKPKYRLIIPLDREVGSDEYQAISRMIADQINIELFDDTTYQPARLMFYPTSCKDGEYVFKYKDAPWLKADEVLNQYPFGWDNIESWPVSSRVLKINNIAGSKQQDPLTKEGMIGAFCRTYSITDVIDKFLSDSYKLSDDGSRATYINGSTSNGVLIYDDKFSYSFHSTDPTSMTLCNAFDLVRINLFGELDKDVRKDTKAENLPSFKKMIELSGADTEVVKTLGKDRIENIKEDFGQVDISEESTEWVKKLKYTKEGIPRNTISNYALIIENEPLLKDKIAFNDFTYKAEIKGKLPWRNANNKEPWSDSDDSGLRGFIENYYSISNANKCRDGFNIVLENQRYNPVRDYFESLQWDGVKRLETLFIDYLGAEDNSYTRAISRKMLVAAITRVYDPGHKFDTMLVLCGNQGIGKSTLLNKLAINENWFSDSNTDISKDKDIIANYRGKLIIEVAEMTGFSKKEVATVKSFITRREFNARLAYGRNNTTYRVQYILFGTTNNEDCLTDETGNRRFWVLDVGKSKPKKDIFKDLDVKEVQQIWAEAKELYKIGESLILNEEENEIALSNQETHMKTNDIEQILMDRLDWEAPKDKWKEYTYTDLCSVLGFSDRLRAIARNTLKTTLSKYGIVQKKSGSKRVYSIPPLQNEDFL